MKEKVTVKECLETISITDAKYNNKEDKNYYLVHKMMDLIPLIKDEDVEILKDEIFKKYCYHTYYSFREYVCVMSKEVTTYNKIQTNNIKNQKVKSTNILDFYESYDENLIRYIKGHLFLEFAMNTILLKALAFSEKRTFSEKINLLFSNSLITKKEKDLLKTINKQRNQIAHNLNYTLTFDTIFNLVKLSAEIGVDYSDSTIYINKKLSKEWYGIEGIITELFPNIFCYLLYKNEKYFEDNEIFKYMI